MKLVPATFPLSPRSSVSLAARRAPLRETGPIRITLRAVEANPTTSQRPRTLSFVSSVTAAKKKSASTDVVMMLL